ncbi:MAG: DUF2118 domain-containing protein [Desulfurococcales archaeon]|nr:DUF2118 domain-containing protein [Desulfurococcales archaeon]
MTLNHEFTPRDYEFPRLYVAGEESGEYLVPDLGAGRYTIRRGEPGPREGWMGLKPYEWGWLRIFDPVEARATRAFAVVVPWLDYRALYLGEGAPLKLVEASGVHVNIVAREGEEVEEDSVLAYVVTGKGETKTVRAGCEGVVAYIAWEPGASAERYVYLIIDEDEVEILEPDDEALALLGAH